MEEIAATCSVNVTKEFRVTRKMESVRRGVPQAMKESTVTKVKYKIFMWTTEYLMNSHEFVKPIRQ